MTAQEGGLREPVKWFAGRMEARLQANDHKGGWVGPDFTIRDALERLREELETELVPEINHANPEDGGINQSDAARIINEAADVANFAMMIADRAGRGLQ